MNNAEYRALIIQKLFNNKSIYKYSVIRKNGKSKIVDNLFCLRKRTPETIDKIEKIFNIYQIGEIKNKEIIKKFNLENSKFFDGFKNDKLLFRYDEGGGWYSYKSIKISEIIEEDK